MSRAAAKSIALSKSAAHERTVKVLPASQSDFKVGDRVTHAKFGNGVVKAIDADKLTIQFNGNVTKQVLDDYVKHRRRR